MSKIFMEILDHFKVYVQEVIGSNIVKDVKKLLFIEQSSLFILQIFVALVDTRPDAWAIIYKASKTGLRSDAGSKSSTETGGEWAYSATELNVAGNTRTDIFYSDWQQMVFSNMLDLEDYISQSNDVAKSKLG